MGDLAWILAGGLAMSALAMVGGLTSLLRPKTLERLLLPLVALSAGTLLGGAFFHMLPEALPAGPPLRGALWLVLGFSSFLLLEQALHWHHSHHAPRGAPRPVTYLVLVGDGVHNFLGGLGVASTYLLSPEAGAMAWLAAAAHEVPQELGDFGVLVHGGWSRRRALLWNLASALTFPVGALVAYGASLRFDVAGLVLFGAGNFVYIAASDLIPEIKAEAGPARAALASATFGLGLALMYLLAIAFA